MADEQKAEKQRSELEQALLAEREARRSEMIHRNLGYGDMKGIGSIIIWFIVVALIFAVMYFLS